MAKQEVARWLLAESRSTPRWSPPTYGRVFDVTVALLGLLLTFPLMMVVACLIASERSGPVIFDHARCGRGGRSFNLLKFRTMRRDGDRLLAEHLSRHADAALEWARDHKLRVDPRVTPLGEFLRKSSIDELPQLFNVLRGEMSIVGPRPIVAAEIVRYGRHYAAYCSVRPGITGLWQVSGRNDVTYRRRVLMDALYARRKSVLLDLKLILATVPAVLARRGSY